MVFSTLPGASDGLSLSLPFAVRTKTKRPGEAFALVGPHFNASYTSRNVLSLTGLSSHPLWVRASRKSWSMHRSERVMARVLVVGKSRLFHPGRGVIFNLHRVCGDNAAEIFSFPAARRAPIEGEPDDRSCRERGGPKVSPVHPQVRVGGCRVGGPAPRVCTPMNERSSQYFDSQCLARHQAPALMVEAPHGE